MKLHDVVQESGLQFFFSPPKYTSQLINLASLKPDTYRSKPMLAEKLPACVVFYRKLKGTYVVEYDF